MLAFISCFVMKYFLVKVEEGREGNNGTLSVDPMYLNFLSKKIFLRWTLISVLLGIFSGNLFARTS
ncbi:hypothetical protein Fmac_026107 [Flemingia macrophylla]|uniref:Uncharacterized protein n=1 Tax=Flemingia macrophylla TaxID=520843 RepID=A0ABD1LE62_9FABA